MTSIETDKFYALWNRLHRFALKRGISYHDAEDLVSASFVSAIEKYDEAHGQFDTFCLSILCNRMKNYWRDRKHTVPDGIDELPENGNSALDDLIDEEETMMRKSELDKHLKDLTEKERKFMIALGEVLEELGSRGVSEAARRVGITPNEGHRILAKIRRRASDPIPPVESRQFGDSDVVLQESTTPRDLLKRYSVREENTLFGEGATLAASAARWASVDRLLHSLSDVQQEQLQNALRTLE